MYILAISNKDGKFYNFKVEVGVLFIQYITESLLGAQLSHH